MTLASLTGTTTMIEDARKALARPDGLKIGDHFVRSYGYDQTNISFFRVVGFTPSGKSVRVQQTTKIVVDDSGPTTHVVPGPDVIGKVITKIVRHYGSTPSLPWDSYSWVGLWDGTPRYETGAGWGH
jgi:hypothetical protein